MPTLFFDLDGTLIDPKLGIVTCLHHALDAMGVEDYPQNLDWCIGPPLQESFAKLVGEDRMQEGVRLYRERYSTKGIYENSLYPGIPELLASLKKQGYELHLATSKVQVYASKILDHFDLAQYFGMVFGSEMDGTRANKADLLAYALEQSGTTASDAMMLGDRKHDILGAKANEIPSVGLLWGYGSRQELEEAGADRIATSIPELAQMLG